MHVVWLTHNYPRHPGDLAGAFLHPLAAAIARRGTRITVLAPSDAGQGGQETRDGVRIRRVRYASPDRERYAYTGTMAATVRSLAGLLALRGLVRSLRREARQQRPDIVHAHWWIPAGLAAPPEIPSMITLHGTDGAWLIRSAIARAMARPVLRRAREVTTVSASLASAVRRTAGPRGGVVRIQPMPVDTSGWPWSRGGAGAVVVARLTRQKRVHLALDAVAALHERGRSLPLVVIGDGPERAALERRAEALHLGDLIRFTGFLSVERVRDHLATADVFLLPAIGEGYGLAAAEALMVGVPAVACTDGGGLLDVVPPAGAGRIALPTAAGIAAALEALLDAPGARPAAVDLGTALRERLFPDSVADRFLEWYAEVIRA